MIHENMHLGPMGATGDGNQAPQGIIETGAEFKPADLNTWEQDSNQVLNISPEQGPNFLNGMKQVPVGNMNKDNH